MEYSGMKYILLQVLFAAIFYMLGWLAGADATIELVKKVLP